MGITATGVFCREQLLVSYLRPSNIDASRHSWTILALLVKRLLQKWPEVKIVLRADSGFCRHKMLRWCERHHVGYIVGLAQNARLRALLAPELLRAEAEHQRTGEKVRLFTDLEYVAATWKITRRVIGKAEHTPKGSNPRFVVTNLTGPAQSLYDELYCARGEMENRIKEHQLGLFADRTSCHDWWANQFRLLLSSCAYVLVEAVRRLALHGTDWARAQVQTIRLTLFKIGTVILRNTRRNRLLFSSAFPHQQLFTQALDRLSSASTSADKYPHLEKG